jgi:hypothetical protein
MPAFNFISKFLELTKIIESPTSYLVWSAYITLSSVMRHNIYYNFPARKTKVCPNLYVILVGDSGATRKSTPLKICNFLLKQIGNTKLIEGRASIQGILKELASVQRIEKRIIKDASCLLYSEEFAASIVKDPSVTGILTDLYDYHDEHNIILKTEDTLKLTKVCINLFSATNAAFLQDMFNKQDLFGGLVGRTFFIIEERARQKDLGLRDTATEQDWEPLVNHLRKLSMMEGEVIIKSDALDFIENWYNTTDFAKFESKTGYEHRAHTHAMKLALILASAEESFDRSIELKHITQAVDIVTGLRGNYHKMVATVGMSQNNTVQAVKDITLILFNNMEKALPKSEIMRALFGRVDTESFDKAIITLDQSKFIEISGTSDPYYQLSQNGKDKIFGQLAINGKGKPN